MPLFTIRNFNLICFICCLRKSKNLLHFLFVGKHSSIPSVLFCSIHRLFKRNASAITTSRLQNVAQLFDVAKSHRWALTGQSIPLLYITLMAARSVGAITPNNSTNSISDIPTLLSGIFTLPFSLIVIIARSIVTLLLRFH